MKLIIDLDDDIAKGIRGENDCKVEPSEIVRSFQATIAEAIANAIPYDDSGDLISREALKTATARPKGKWIFKHNSSDIWCSVCDENFDEIPQAFDFCPNCGADMRGGNE